MILLGPYACFPKKKKKEKKKKRKKRIYIYIYIYNNSNKNIKNDKKINKKRKLVIMKKVGDNI